MRDFRDGRGGAWRGMGSGGTMINGHEARSISADETLPSSAMRNGP